VVALKRAWPYRRRLASMTKQERRGGIETCPPGEGWAQWTVKQERRGGIETSLLDGARSASHSRKQERRGGIETTCRPSSSASTISEAGTPWWH
jgi:hypothetical protein